MPALHDFCLLIFRSQSRQAKDFLHEGKPARAIEKPAEPRPQKARSITEPGCASMESGTSNA